MPKDNTIEAWLRCDYIVSVNHAYQFVGKGKRKSKVKNEEARRMIRQLQRSLNKFLPLETIPANRYLDVTYGFYIGEDQFNRRDVDNMVKIAQDTIFEHLEGNDNKILYTRQYKKPLRDSDFEYVYFKIKVLRASFVDDLLIKVNRG